MTTATDTISVGPGRGGRMSRPRKREAVLRLLRGECSASAPMRHLGLVEEWRISGSA